MAWSDRQYAGNEGGPFFGGTQKSVTFWIIAITFAIQVIVWLIGGGQRGAGTNAIYGFLALRWDYLLSWQIWRYASYLFLHGGVFHLVLNMFVLHFLGRMLEPHFGRKKFLILYLGLGAFAALGHPVFEMIKGAPYAQTVIGASGSVTALAVLFGARFPKAPVSLFSIPMTGATMAAVFVGFDILSIIATQGESGTAFGVHLGGALGGLIYGLYGHRIDHSVESIRDAREQKIRTKEANRKQAEKVELDRILEKINAQGMGELTDQERDFLKRQSERLKDKF